MPVIPEASNFPSGPQNTNNKTKKEATEPHGKAAPTDFLSKGPQIPESA